VLVECNDCLFDPRGAGDREVQIARAHIVQWAVVELVRGQLRERRNIELDTGPRFAATCVE
jgi:hypothetical protein